MHAIALRAPRALVTLLSALALAFALLAVSAGAAHADVATSCANRNANSIKPANNSNGNGVKTVCPPASAASERAVPQRIPAGSGPSVPAETATVLGLGLAGAGLAVRRFAAAGAR